MNFQNGNIYVSVIENKNIGIDHFSVELKNVKRFMLRTMTTTTTFRKENGINLIVMIKWT